MSEGHLDQEQLARRRRLAERTLERWRWAGRGPAYLKIGGAVRYALSDIESYEQQHRRDAAEGDPS